MACSIASHTWTHALVTDFSTVYDIMPSRLQLLIIVSPVVIAILWRVLDANPSLFAYDFVVSENRRYAAFQNKTVWVTGASSGIGAELVCELVKAQAFHGAFMNE